MIHTLRRADLAMEGEKSAKLLRDGEYGVLSTASTDGMPYGTPLNYCVIDNAIYFHSALEGHKLDNINANPKVSFCVVGKTKVLPAKFDSHYESVIVSGTATEVYGDEKQAALEGLVNKYSPHFRAAGLAYIASDAFKTRVFGISINTIIGKVGK